jgi:hypothetical protein
MCMRDVKHRSSRARTRPTASEDEHARLARILEEALERRYIAADGKIREVVAVVQRLALRRAHNHVGGGDGGGGQERARSARSIEIPLSGL